MHHFPVGLIHLLVSLPYVLVPFIIVVLEDGFGLCFELANYPETAAWCADLGDLYNLPTTHVDGPCARDAVVITCDLPALGLFPVPTTVYYYASGFTLESATEACTSSGGVVGPAP